MRPPVPPWARFGGVALYGRPVDGFVVRVDLDRADLDAAEDEVVAAAEQVTTLRSSARASRSLRLEVADDADGKLADMIEEAVAGARVFSIGRAMEIVKDLGAACDIDERYQLSGMTGTHAIGHTRMATESIVDIAHSHPFWARPFPDISVVHNGQITNYHKLRRRLEQKGHRFATGNDSEVIAVYIADKLEAGESLDTALRASIDDLDGTFAYLISTADGIGLARISSPPSRCSTQRTTTWWCWLPRRSRSARSSTTPASCRASSRPRRSVGGCGDRGRRRRRGPGDPRGQPGDQGGDRRGRDRDPRGEPRRTPCVRGRARHTGVHIVFDGPAGWYTAGMNGGPHIELRGNVGWGLAECMMRGTVDVHGHAGSGTAASIRGGSVFVEGDTGARAGIAMKGGTLVVGGDVGYMTGFMMQLGTIVVCGDAADGLGDSMYEGTIYVGGSIASRGVDAEIEEMTDDDVKLVSGLLVPHDIDVDAASFTKVRSGRKLWNFSTKEPELWKSAL